MDPISAHQEFPSTQTQTTASRFEFSNFVDALDQHGKLIHGNTFVLNDDDKTVFLKLYAYLTADQNLCELYQIDVEKGIFLTGEVGVGKTFLMRLICPMYPYKERFKIKSCQQISLEYIDQGANILLYYGRNYADYIDLNILDKVYCFDDLGSEEGTKHYGNDANVMAQIIQMRYTLFQNRKVLTHFTSNLTAGQLEQSYGIRIRSRLREMCNWIEFPKTSKDKRK